MKTFIALCLCGLSVPLPAQTTLRTFTSPDGIFQSSIQMCSLIACRWENGSAQQSVRKCILGGFLKGDGFDLGNGQALRLQQQVSEIPVATTTPEECFGISLDRFDHPRGTLVWQ
jgi:hypothetical protein